MASTVELGLVDLVDWNGWGVLLDDNVDDIDHDDDDDGGENAKDGVISTVKTHKMRMPIGIKVSRFLLRRLALPFRWSRSTSSDGRDVGQDGSFVMGNVGSIGEEGQQFMTLLID